MAYLRLMRVSSVSGGSGSGAGQHDRRYIIWRNNHAYDERLRRIVARASAA